MCRTLGAAKPSSRMHWMVSSMTAARVRSARSWLPPGGRRGVVLLPPMASTSPHHAPKVICGPQVVGRQHTLGGQALRFDGVDGARRGGDHAALIVVDSGAADVRVDLDAGAPGDDDAVHARVTVGRVRPIGGGGGGEPVDVLHRDDDVVVASPFDAEAYGGHPTRLDLHHRAVDWDGCHPGFVPFPNLVECDPEIFGETSDL